MSPKRPETRVKTTCQGVGQVALYEVGDPPRHTSECQQDSIRALEEHAARKSRARRAPWCDGGRTRSASRLLAVQARGERCSVPTQKMHTIMKSAWCGLHREAFERDGAGGKSSRTALHRQSLMQLPLLPILRNLLAENGHIFVLHRHASAEPGSGCGCTLRCGARARGKKSKNTIPQSGAIQCERAGLPCPMKRAKMPAQTRKTEEGRATKRVTCAAGGSDRGCAASWRPTCVWLCEQTQPCRQP